MHHEDILRNLQIDIPVAAITCTLREKIFNAWQMFTRRVLITYLLIVVLEHTKHFSNEKIYIFLKPPGDLGLFRKAICPFHLNEII